jgi:hypothetical protein
VTAVQLADGVWRIPLAPLDLLNAFLVEGDDGSLTLLDAGTTRAPRRVLAATGSRVLTHEREAVHVREGRMPTPDRSTWGGRLLARNRSRESARRLADLDDDTAGCTHGSHVSSGARGAVRAFLAGRAS